ncbi:MAG: DNA polymerase III subunit gamma/tau [Chloroflexota bacterium]
MSDLGAPQALYRKWRPQAWEAVIGQGHVVGTLRSALAAGKMAHAYLFSGPRGTGKTTTARLLAKAANCLEDDLARRPCGECAHCQAVNQGRFMDLIEIDAASNTSVEDVRDLRDKINFSPNQGRYKVYIIDEVHMLSTAAFNALLKTLEEPPPHAVFILATTEVHKIPATVLSRCQRHEFRRISVAEIAAHLKSLADREGIQAAPEALNLIARQSTGAMRDAISLLDQLASTGQAITIEMAQEVLGTAASGAVLALLDALVAKDSAAGLDRIHAALDAGSDPRQFARQVVDYLRDLLLIKMGNAAHIDAAAETRAQMARHAQSFSIPELLRAIRLFTFAAGEARAAWQPSLPLEMAFVEALEPPAAEPAPQPAASAGPAARPAPPARAAAPSAAPAAHPAAPAPAAPAGEPAAAARPSAPEDNSSSQKLAQVWKDILNQVRRSSNAAYAALNSVTGKAMRGNKLVLSFGSDIIKEKVEKPESMDLLRQALQQVFGFEVFVVCVIDSARRDSVPPGVDDDGMVAAALRDLGGELVDYH